MTGVVVVASLMLRDHDSRRNVESQCYWTCWRWSGSLYTGVGGVWRDAGSDWSGLQISHSIPQTAVNFGVVSCYERTTVDTMSRRGFRVKEQLDLIVQWNIVNSVYCQRLERQSNNLCVLPVSAIYHWSDRVSRWNGLRSAWWNFPRGKYLYSLCPRFIGCRWKKRKDEVKSAEWL